MLKTLIAATVVTAVACSPAAATPLEDAFADLLSLAEGYTGETIDDTMCNDVLCNLYVDEEQINLTWPTGGWMSVTYFPYTSDAETQLVLCGTVIDFTTGLGPEGSGVLAGRLMAEAQSGDVRTDVGGAQIGANLTTSGKLECSAKRPQPID